MSGRSRRSLAESFFHPLIFKCESGQSIEASQLEGFDCVQLDFKRDYVITPGLRLAMKESSCDGLMLINSPVEVLQRLIDEDWSIRNAWISQISSSHEIFELSIKFISKYISILYGLSIAYSGSITIQNIRDLQGLLEQSETLICLDIPFDWYPDDMRIFPIISISTGDRRWKKMKLQSVIDIQIPVDIGTNRINQLIQSMPNLCRIFPQWKDIQEGFDWITQIPHLSVVPRISADSIAYGYILTQKYQSIQRVNCSLIVPFTELETFDGIDPKKSAVRFYNLIFENSYLQSIQLEIWDQSKQTNLVLLLDALYKCPELLELRLKFACFRNIRVDRIESGIVKLFSSETKLMVFILVGRFALDLAKKYILFSKSKSASELIDTVNANHTLCSLKIGDALRIDPVIKMEISQVLKRNCSEIHDSLMLLIVSWSLSFTIDELEVLGGMNCLMKRPLIW